MKLSVMTLILAAVMMTVTGCAKDPSTGASTQIALNSGNWLLYANSSVTANSSPSYPHNMPIRGILTVSGNAISTNLAVNNGVSLPCFQNPFDPSGEVSGGSVTLAPPSDKSNLAISATIEPGSILLGTYNCSPQQGNADNGTIYGVNVPSLTGSWSGTAPYVLQVYSGGVVTSKDYPVVVTASIQQASFSSPINGLPAFSLSGTVTLTSSYCFVSGASNMTIDPSQSYVSGDIVDIIASASNGTMNYSGFSSQPPITIPTTASQLSATMTITGDNNNCSISVTTPLAKS
ncbi:MAG: hypothetical protein WAN35_16330 [Terracidiphilus sp.]